MCPTHKRDIEEKCPAPPNAWLRWEIQKLTDAVAKLYL